MTNTISHTSGQPARLAIMGLTDEAINTARAEEGMVALIGRAGLGKTFSAQYLLAQHSAHYLRASVHWTPKTFLAALLFELGEDVRIDRHNLYTLMNRARDALRRWNGPLIIDEADMLFELSGKTTENAQRKIETVRELFDATGVPIVLIGEEHLDGKSKQWERFHRRIVEWVRAPAASLADAQLLAKVYAPGLIVADDLTDHICKTTNGSVSRIKQNIQKASRRAALSGVLAIDLDWWHQVNLTVTTGDVLRPRGDA